MCGRVRLSSDYSEIKIKLKFDGPPPNFERDWNKPPTAPMLVAVRSVDGRRTPKMMRWGLLPHWAKDEKIAYSTFNARAEEFTGKPAFRDAWKNGQRCLVVTDGFYEWKKLDPKGKEKQPYAIAMADNGQMVMAGLWATWKDPKSGSEIQSCTILTTDSNGVMGELHNRMPVILAEKDWARWLGEEHATIRTAFKEKSRADALEEARVKSIDSHKCPLRNVWSDAKPVQVAPILLCS